VRQFGMRRSTGTAALLVALLAAAGCAPVVVPRPLEGAAAVVGVASVIDGDTIEIHGHGH
jgi:endonuclease YncB( thermonuclease family)